MSIGYIKLEAILTEDGEYLVHPGGLYPVLLVDNVIAPMITDKKSIDAGNVVEGKIIMNSEDNIMYIGIKGDN